MAHFKFFLAVLFLVLWVISTYLGFVFFRTEYTDVLRLEQINYQYTTSVPYAVSVSGASYNLFVILIYFLCSGSWIVLVFSFAKRNWVWQELRVVKKEWNLVWQRIRQLIKSLSPPETAIAVSILALILLVRIYYLFQHFFITDEVASFDLFVVEGALAISSFYPIPNNHILSNLLSLGFYQLFSNPVLVMRLPVFLVSLVGTVIMYVVLTRYCGFAIATCSIGILCFSQMGIFYAIAGRGYFLLNVLSFVGFFSMLNLMYKADSSRLYWFLLIISGVLGFYTVPTFLYPFTSILAIGCFYFFWKGHTKKIAQLIVSGFIVSLGSILLYLPLILISGLDSLINNEYVQPMSSAVFWAKFPVYAAYTEGLLIGQGRLGKYILWLGLLIPVIIIFYKKTRLFFLKFLLPALVMTFLPYLFLIMQRLYAPDRALFYKSIYLYIALSFLFFYLVKKINLPKPYMLGLSGIGLLLYTVYQIYYLQKENIPARLAEEQRKETFRWLKKQQSANIIVQEPFYNLYLNHYFKLAKLPCNIHGNKKANQPYDFLMLPVNQPVIADSLKVKWDAEVYRNDLVKIYKVEL